MGAGRGKVRSRGPQFWSESGVFRLVRDLGGGAVFWVVLPVYTFRMGRTGEDLMGWETQAPEGRE